MTNFVFKILHNEKTIIIENHLKNMKKYIKRNENSSLNRTLINTVKLVLINSWSKPKNYIVFIKFNQRFH